MKTIFSSVYLFIFFFLCHQNIFAQRLSTGPEFKIINQSIEFDDENDVFFTLKQEPTIHIHAGELVVQPQQTFQIYTRHYNSTTGEIKSSRVLCEEYVKPTYVLGYPVYVDRERSTEKFFCGNYTVIFTLRTEVQRIQYIENYDHERREDTKYEISVSIFENDTRVPLLLDHTLIKNHYTQQPSGVGKAAAARD